MTSTTRYETNFIYFVAVISQLVHYGTFIFPCTWLPRIVQSFSFFLFIFSAISYAIVIDLLGCISVLIHIDF